MMKKNTKYSILSEEGFQDFYGLAKSSKDTRIDLTLANGMTIKCSKDHRLKRGKSWVEAENIETGDILEFDEGSCSVSQKETIPGVFDFFEPLQCDSSTYYANGILSHNCSFIGSSNTLVSPGTLRSLASVEPTAIKENVRFFHYPEKNRQYFMSVDTAEAKGLDYHAITVVDITERPFKLVATYKDNTTPPISFANIVYRIGKIYNEACILVEGKSTGLQVNDILFHDLEYENLLGSAPNGRNGQKLTMYGRKARGLATSKTTKSIGCNTLKMILDNQQMFVNDEEVVDELTQFTLQGNSYKAEPGYHDDLVMTLVNFAWATTQEFFKNLSLVNIQDMVEEESRQIENNLVFGVVLDSDQDFDGFHGSTFM